MISIAPNTKIKAYALVRDAQGRPVVDGDPRLLHDSIKAALTNEEFNWLLEQWLEQGNN